MVAEHAPDIAQRAGTAHPISDRAIGTGWPGHGPRLQPPAVV